MYVPQVAHNRHHGAVGDDDVRAQVLLVLGALLSLRHHHVCAAHRSLITIHHSPFTIHFFISFFYNMANGSSCFFFSHQQLFLANFSTFQLFALLFFFHLPPVVFFTGGWVPLAIHTLRVARFTVSRAGFFLL